MSGHKTGDTRNLDLGDHRRSAARPAPLSLRHFKVGKDYAQAAHRHGDGETMLRSRIAGTLTYPGSRPTGHAPEPLGRSLVSTSIAGHRS